jgi:hypothetical protein
MTDPPALSVIAASGPQSPKSIKAIWRLRVKPAMTGVTVIAFCLSACKIQFLARTVVFLSLSSRLSERIWGLARLTVVRVILLFILYA